MTHQHLKKTGIILIFLGFLLNNPLVIIPGCILLLLGILSWFLSHYLLKGIHCTFTLERHRARIGEEIQGRITFINHQPFPIPFLHFSMESPKDLVIARGQIKTSYQIYEKISLIWFQRVIKNIQIICSQRGEYFFGSIQLETKDLLGLSSGKKSIEGNEKLIVYPRILDVYLKEETSKSPFGPEKKASFIFEDPSRLKGVREYRTSDPFSRIHWKATARTGKLKSKLVEASTSQEIAFVINTNTGEYIWELDRDLLERTILTASSLLALSQSLKHEFGIYLNGLVRGSRIPAAVKMGTGERHFLSCLEVLGRILPTTHFPIERILRSTSQRLGDRSRMIILTGILTEPLSQAILEQSRRGRDLTLILTRKRKLPENLKVPIYTILEEESWDELKSLTLYPYSH